MSHANLIALAGRLGRIGYRGLLRASASVEAPDDPWSIPDAPALLLSLALDPRWPTRTRFLAAEAIFARDMFRLRPEHYPLLAPLYVRALAENASGFMADWGFLRGMDDVGPLGSRFVSFGEAADPLLRPLLDDTRGVPYLYPPEFPSQIRTDLRIRDFAALYLSQIHRIPITLSASLAEREGEIDRLKTLLP
jgi:hypothetical protein